MNEALERVARYREGELSPVEMRAVEQEPGFADRLAQLIRLEEAVRALPESSPGLDTEALLSRVRRPPARGSPGSKKNFAVGLAVLAVAALVLVFRANPGSEHWALVSPGEATVNGQPVKSRLEALHSGTVRAPLGAQLLKGEDWVGLPPGAEARLDAETVELLRGNAVASGAALSLRADGARVQLHGVAVLSMEPEAGVARVTEALTQFPGGALMKNEWMKLSSVAAVAAAAGVGLTVFVVSGSAEVQPAGAPPVEVKAGQQWKPGSPGAPSSFALAAAPVRPARQDTPSEAALEGTSTRPTSPALAAMSRDQLVALVEQLSDEKEALLVQREKLKKKLEDNSQDPPPRNYYRFSPEELAASAKKGELRLRGPQLQGEEFKIDDKVADDLRLTPDERAKARAIFQASTERVRQGLLALYAEIGGDPNQAAILSSETILNELRGKALNGDFASAVRQLANERAGLAAPIAGGPPVYRAYRLFLVEDERVIAELEQLLGPRRTEAFLNHDKLSHSDHTFGVGPPPEKQ